MAIKIKSGTYEFKKRSLEGTKTDAVLVLTVSLAGFIDPGEVLVAAAFVGAFGVVAHVGTDSKLETLILI